MSVSNEGLHFRVSYRIHRKLQRPLRVGSAGHVIQGGCGDLAIVAQAAWSALLVLSGTFEQLLTYTGFGVILFSALAVLSLFFVRRTPTESATFRAWGYPWAPALFCIVSFAIVINTVGEAPGVASAGLGVMAAGVPMYWWVKRRNGKRKTENGKRQT